MSWCRKPRENDTRDRPKCFLSDFIFLWVQILRIVKTRSIEGLSVPSFELECVGYTVSCAYCWTMHVPFSAYGELIFLTMQGGASQLSNFYANSFQAHSVPARGLPCSATVLCRRGAGSLTLPLLAETRRVPMGQDKPVRLSLTCSFWISVDFLAL